MSPKLLSDDELIAILPILRSKEKEAILVLLYHLIEFDERALYLQLGFSSLFKYVTTKLHYSEGSAQKGKCLRINEELDPDMKVGSRSAGYGKVRVDNNPLYIDIELDPPLFCTIIPCNSIALA